MRIWAVVTLVVCIGVTAAQAANGRNRYATMNNVGLRVLPNHQLTEWFQDQGMPVDDALLERTGKSSFDNSWDMLTSPDLAEFRDWADTRGQRTTLISYFRFAPHWTRKLWHDLPVILASDQSAYDKFGVSERLPDPPPLQLAGPTTRNGLKVWTLIAVTGLVLAVVRRRHVQAIVLGLLLVSSFIDLYMAYVGDSVEVQRHMVGPLSRMSLIMIICLGIGVDCALESLRGVRIHPAGDAAVDEADLVDDEARTVELVPARDATR
jgi:hypothetical protein